MDGLPQYTKDERYRILARTAANAGVRIIYKDLKGASGNYKNGKIIMATDYSFKCVDDAVFTLAHEIAHAITADLHSGFAGYEYTYVRRFCEASADVVGAALYSLSQMIFFEDFSRQHRKDKRNLERLFAERERMEAEMCRTALT